MNPKVLTDIPHPKLQNPPNPKPKIPNPQLLALPPPPNPFAETKNANHRQAPCLAWLCPNSAGSRLMPFHEDAKP